MTILGDPSAWIESFPDDLIPKILQLVVDGWQKFKKPAPDAKETTITREFRNALVQEKNARRLPIRIYRETPIDHPQTTKELGRLDLQFIPINSALEDVYFTIECKRLYAQTSPPVPNGSTSTQGPAATAPPAVQAAPTVPATSATSAAPTPAPVVPMPAPAAPTPAPTRAEDEDGLQHSIEP